jgi:hypothetical protein
VKEGQHDSRSAIALDVRGEFVDGLSGCVVGLEGNNVSGSRHGSMGSERQGEEGERGGERASS